MIVITSPEQMCKHCLGSAWHKSNISQKYRKCRFCKGTGLRPKNEWTHQDPVPQEQLEPDRKDFLSKTIIFPFIWQKKYQISRSTLSPIWSAKIASVWTFLILFPKIASLFIKKQNKE